jgi:Mg2+ and Co2+ transporter CorA
MPPDRRVPPVNTEPPTRDYDADPLWKSKPLTPAQILTHDIKLESLRADRGPMLECNERAPSSLVPDAAATTSRADFARSEAAAVNPIEERRFKRLEEDFGWIKHLRLKDRPNPSADGSQTAAANCRWIHCSSKYPEYLNGFLYALVEDTKIVSKCMHLLDNAVQQKQRFSKHGKHFVPFVTLLTPLSHGGSGSSYPMLISTPWLDWSINGQTPPLRFQIDRKEGYTSSRSSCHPIRSLLAYYFRLEDTREREVSQVFSRNKPWQGDREIDLRIRQWYGHYPSALNVDELWLLAIDAEHIVTFSSNQTWKARWPPLQLTSRISDVAFRDVRNMFHRSHQNDTQEYTAMTHVITALSGAMGMMHRSFWQDLPLCLTDRFAGHLGHLQYGLHRSPTTKLVMDLLACQEELNIVIQITQKQLDLINEVHELTRTSTSQDQHASPSSPRRSIPPLSLPGDPPVSPRSTQNTFHHPLTASPIAKLQDNLQRELSDLQDLRDNANTLVSRTIQLVNLRMESSSKAMLVFTVVTIIFLPLNFVTSFFGMNVSDIRNMQATQSLFWLVAMCVTAGVFVASIFLAFQGGKILDRMLLWIDARKERAALKAPAYNGNFRLASPYNLNGYKMR